MNALILNAPGEINNLFWRDVPIPDIEAKEVLIAVKSLSINPIDAKTRSGKGLYPMLQNENPLILGWDISGIVVKTGSSVTEFQQGNEVFGMINFPGHGKVYAEYVAAPAAHLALKPKNVSHPEAAAASLAALTAWQAITGFSEIKKGKKILIHAAAGGVGHFAVQIAKHLGAWVAGTSSAANKDFVLHIGADKHIDYNAAPLKEQVADIDFVLDTLGGESIDCSLEVMKAGATIVSIPSGLNEGVISKADAKGMKGYTFKVHSDGNDMKTIARLLQQNMLNPHVSHRFPFSDIHLSHKQIETGRTRGKIIVSLE